MRLYKALENHSKEGFTSFHMPGHKSKNIAYVPSINDDITELSGMDDLQNPKGIIKDSLILATKLYSSKASFFSTNGSTASNMAAINAVTDYKDSILICGSCHRSLFNIAKLKDLNIIEIKSKKLYAYPDVDAPVEPDEISKALKVNNKIRAVFITSPTYEGIVSDIKTISGIVHSFGIPLIVDEAHGSHLELSSHFPKSALQNDADLVINSLHKNLPALTGTSLLHIGKNSGLSPDLIQESLLLFLSTSPSYLLLSSIDRCLTLIEERGAELFDRLNKNLNEFYDLTKNLKNISLLNADKSLHDRSRIIVLSPHITGENLYTVLRNEYKIEMEKSEKSFVVGISTISDNKDDFLMLAEALRKIDEGIENGKYHN